MSRPKIYLSGGKIKVEKPEDIDRLKSEHAKLEAANKVLVAAAKEVIVHFNLGTLKGRPKALVACGDLAAALKAADEIEKE